MKAVENAESIARELIAREFLSECAIGPESYLPCRANDELMEQYMVENRIPFALNGLKAAYQELKDQNRLALRPKAPAPAPPPAPYVPTPAEEFERDYPAHAAEAAFKKAGITFPKDRETAKAVFNSEKGKQLHKQWMGMGFGVTQNRDFNDYRARYQAALNFKESEETRGFDEQYPLPDVIAQDARDNSIDLPTNKHEAIQFLKNNATSAFYKKWGTAANAFRSAYPKERLKEIEAFTGRFQALLSGVNG